jgi:hypothetical protein
MTELNKDLIHNNAADRQRAIVEAGRLIDLLADDFPDVQTIKDQWYSVGLCLRAAIAEIRQAEQKRNASIPCAGVEQKNSMMGF